MSNISINNLYLHHGLGRLETTHMLHNNVIIQARVIGMNYYELHVCKYILRILCDAIMYGCHLS